MKTIKYRRLLLNLASYLVRSVGMSLGGAGVVLSIWFFFISNKNNDYIWGFGFLLLTLIGYVIFKYGHEKMINEYDN